MWYARLSLVAVAVLLVSLSIQSGFASYTLTLNVVPILVAQGQTLILSGSETPPRVGVDISLYHGSTCEAAGFIGIDSVLEDSLGDYSYSQFIDPASYPAGVYSAQAADNVQPPSASPCVSFTVVEAAPRPVGGIVEPVNKLAVLAPWLAVIGLVGCIGTVVVVAKKCR